MASLTKLMSFIIGVVALGALSSTVFGYFTNITDSLTTAGYGWAATIIVLSIVVGLIYMFVPKRK